MIKMSTFILVLSLRIDDRAGDILVSPDHHRLMSVVWVPRDFLAHRRTVLARAVRSEAAFSEMITMMHEGKEPVTSGMNVPRWEKISTHGKASIVVH
jgi:hypothetical protein